MNKLLVNLWLGIIFYFQDIVITLGSIDEHVMHMIVMMAEDNLEPNFDSSLKRIDIVKGSRGFFLLESILSINKYVCIL